MKTNKFLLAFAAILLFVSCEKDENKDLVASKNSHRIKQIAYPGGKTVFTYEGENLVKTSEYKKDDSDNWIEDYRMEFSYSGDIVTETRGFLKSEIWEINSKAEYHIQNGLIKEEHYYDYEDGTWVEERNWTYQYSGSNITGWQSFYYDEEGGTPEPDEKGEYFYENGKVKEYKVYELDDSGNWSQYDKETFTYDGSNLANWINYGLDESDNWENNYKYEYQYSGDKVSQMTNFLWNSEDSQWESHRVITVIYNSNGYLSETRLNIDYVTTYEYEEGHGNAVFIFSHPMDLIYGGPTVKSADSGNRAYIPYYQRLNNR